MHEVNIERWKGEIAQHIVENVNSPPSAIVRDTRPKKKKSMKTWKIIKTL